MERVFLDANVLFSAAYLESSRLRNLWKLRDAELLSSAYAVQEAYINLEGPEARGRLERLVSALSIVVEAPEQLALPPNVFLIEKDRPILLAALNARATHLLTGDTTHFGALLGSRIGSLEILTPAANLARRRG